MGGLAMGGHARRRLATRPLRALGLASLAALALLWGLAAPAAQANVSDLSVQFCSGQQCFENKPTTTSQVGARPQYIVSFKVANGFDGQTDTITVWGPEGTRFPPLWDKGTYYINAHWVKGGVVMLDPNGSGVEIRPANPDLQVPPGGLMRVHIGVAILVQDRNVINTTVAGEHELWVGVSGQSGTATKFTLTPGPATEIQAVDGPGRRIPVGGGYTEPLVVRVVDPFGNPLSGELVEFRLPPGPASGVFEDGERTAQYTTGADGIARSPLIAPTGTRGTWTAQAALPNRRGIAPLAIPLRNYLPGADEIELTLEPPTLPADGVATGSAQVRVLDGRGEPLPGVALRVRTDEGVRAGPVSDQGDGTYRFDLRAGAKPGEAEVRVEDPETGVSARATLTLERDTTIPSVRITKAPPKRVKRKRVGVRFASDAHDLARFECRVDAGAWRSCRSPATLRVRPGRHVFRVRAVDFAGNRSRPAQARFRVRR